MMSWTSSSLTSRGATWFHISDLIHQLRSQVQLELSAHRVFLVAIAFHRCLLSHVPTFLAFAGTSLHSVALPSSFEFIASDAFPASCDVTLLDSGSVPGFDEWNKLRESTHPVAFELGQTFASETSDQTPVEISLSNPSPAPSKPKASKWKHGSHLLQITMCGMAEEPARLRVTLCFGEPDSLRLAPGALGPRNAFLAAGIVQGIVCLHRSNIVHGNLAPDSIEIWAKKRRYNPEI